MATMITSECINCGACEPECPNTAIYQGAVEWEAPDGSMHPAISDEIFYIVPEKCTECVGFHDHEACAAVCPVDCCVPNPDIPETHDVLLLRARALHPEQTIPDDAPSRFAKAETGAGASAPAAAATPPPPPAASAASDAPAPRAEAASVQPPAAPPAAKAAPIERKIDKPAARAPAAPKVFAGEFPGDFDQIVGALGAPRRQALSWRSTVALGLLAAGQGVFGALGDGAKRRIEAAVGDRRFFNAELATAANVFLNLLLYPTACVVLGTVLGRAGLFTSATHWWIVLGVLLAVGEAAWRLHENFFRGRPITETPLRGAAYGPLLLPAGALVTALAGRTGASSGVGFDGFHGDQHHFDDKLERARRYGEVFRLVDRGDAYLLQVEFPRVVPPSTIGASMQLPTVMPDYDYELTLENGAFVVHARVDDPHVRSVTGAAPAFPSEFTTRVPLAQPVAGFRHRYRDKTLDVVLPKVSTAA